MTEPDPKLTPAEPDDLANSLSFALRFEGRKSQHDSDRLNADIVAKRLVRYLDKAGYVVMKKPPLGGHDPVARGFGQKWRPRQDPSRQKPNRSMMSRRASDWTLWAS
jgi:hypothetical protein